MSVVSSDTWLACFAKSDAEAEQATAGWQHLGRARAWLLEARRRRGEDVGSRGYCNSSALLLFYALSHPLLYTERMVAT
jgi:hypothetical protein